MPITKKVQGIIMAGLIAACTLAPSVALAADHTASVGNQSGTGQTDLTLITADDGTEHTETSTNVAFSFPAKIAYVVAADGTLTGPNESAAYIESKSRFQIRVNAMVAAENDNWHIVNSDAATTSASTSNNAYLLLGPTGHQENIHGRLTRNAAGAEIATANKTAWSMPGYGSHINLASTGKVGKVDKDITTEKTFARITWYVTTLPISS